MTRDLCTWVKTLLLIYAVHVSNPPEISRKCVPVRMMILGGGGECWLSFIDVPKIVLGSVCQLHRLTHQKFSWKCRCLKEPEHWCLSTPHPTPTHTPHPSTQVFFPKKAWGRGKRFFKTTTKMKFLRWKRSYRLEKTCSLSSACRILFYSTTGFQSEIFFYFVTTTVHLYYSSRSNWPWEILKL